MKLLLTFLSVIFFTGAAMAQDPVGTAMPNSIFYNRDSTPFSTYSIPKGKKSLIFFFDATCGHCQKVISEISKRSKELDKLNIIMISQDEYRSIDYFMTNFAKPLLTKPNVKVVQDRDHVFIMAFHPKQYPSMYLYGPDKKIIFSSSSDKDVEKLFKAINTP
ncbi:redoxin domain-containing protein [Pedobacter sp. L105]|uniref:TlpA family protein disulfide reductase n=1 Tax=Pedobacter sp. L105 TaxID=1641871 RepID=UPI00131B67BD|nr:redoxin domain-containing protein [Pedobacter sp. L105]